MEKEKKKRRKRMTDNKDKQRMKQKEQRRTIYGKKTENVYAFRRGGIKRRNYKKKTEERDRTSNVHITKA